MVLGTVAATTGASKATWAQPTWLVVLVAGGVMTGVWAAARLIVVIVRRLAAPRAIHRGDWVRIGPHGVGLVERVGFRSIRLRTAEGRQNVIPWNRIDRFRVEPTTLRQQCRLYTTLGMIRARSSSLAEVRDVIEHILARNADELSGDAVVRFVEPDPSGLVLEVTAWFESHEYRQAALAGDPELERLGRRRQQRRERVLQRARVRGLRRGLLRSSGLRRRLEPESAMA
jgi:hypothetical protein